MRVEQGNRGGEIRSPDITDAAADLSFGSLARELGLDPANRWIGDYVQYECRHLRPLLAA